MRIFYCLCLLLFSLAAQAKVDIKSTKRLIVPVDEVTPKITSKDVEKVVPLDLQSGASQGHVFSRIADRGFTMWFDSIKETAVGRFAESAQEKLKTDIEIGEETDEGVRHRLSFSVEAFQAVARLAYKGWLNAEINYDAKTDCADILVKERVFSDKDLIVSHRNTSDQALSMIGLAWSW